MEAGQSRGTPALQRKPALSIVKRGSGRRAAIVVVCGGFGVFVVGGGPKSWEGVWGCDLRTLESAVLSGSGAAESRSEEDSPLGGLGFGGSRAIRPMARLHASTGKGSWLTESRKHA